MLNVTMLIAIMLNFRGPRKLKVSEEYKKISKITDKSINLPQLLLKICKKSKYLPKMSENLLNIYQKRVKIYRIFTKNWKIYCKFSENLLNLPVFSKIY